MSARTIDEMIDHYNKVPDMTLLAITMEEAAAMQMPLSHSRKRLFLGRPVIIVDLPPTGPRYLQ